VKADKITTAEEIDEIRKSHKVLLEERLSAVSSFEPTAPTPNGQWSPMVWPASGEASSPNTGVPEQILRDVGKASVTISTEGFVRFPSQSSGPGILTYASPRKSILASNVTSMPA
jgi:hypothetical protein